MKRLLLAAATAALGTGMASGIAVADQHLPFPPGEGDFNWDSYEALKDLDVAGEEIVIFGPWMGPDKALFDSVVAYFNEATGARASYSGSDSFEQQIVIDTGAGSPPNIAIFPQPGLASDLAAKGHLVPLPDGTEDWVRENYAAGQSWVDLGSFEGPDGDKALYGFFYKSDVKSLVWYVPENFEDAGYDVPETMEELKELSDQIVADGDTPWCIGLGSGGATGWPATDWVEDMMLRTQSPEVYDQWVHHEIPFDDPAVVGAIEEFGAFARNEDYVAGGAGAVASTDFRDSPKGLFASPPQCYLHRQASFIPAFFPDGTEVGQDADFFYFPSYAGKDLGKPVLGGGTVFGIAKDSKGARAFMNFLQSPIAHEVWMAQKGFLTPHKGVNTELFGDPTLQKMNDILLQADTFRFDGSDLMPGAIGAGAFWTGMVDYAGGADAKAVAKQVEDTWTSLQ